MGTTADKLQAVLNSKNAIRDKFNLGDIPFAQYAENINTGGGSTDGAEFYKCVNVVPVDYSKVSYIVRTADDWFSDREEYCCEYSLVDANAKGKSRVWRGFIPINSNGAAYLGDFGTIEYKTEDGVSGWYFCGLTSSGAYPIKFISNGADPEADYLKKNRYIESGDDLSNYGLRALKLYNCNIVGGDDQNPVTVEWDGVLRRENNWISGDFRLEMPLSGANSENSWYRKSYLYYKDTVIYEFNHIPGEATSQFAPLSKGHACLLESWNDSFENSSWTGQKIEKGSEGYEVTNETENFIYNPNNSIVPKVGGIYDTKSLISVNRMYKDLITEDRSGSAFYLCSYVNRNYFSYNTIVVSGMPTAPFVGCTYVDENTWETADVPTDVAARNPNGTYILKNPEADSYERYWESENGCVITRWNMGMGQPIIYPGNDYKNTNKYIYVESMMGEIPQYPVPDDYTSFEWKYSSGSGEDTVISSGSAVVPRPPEVEKYWEGYKLEADENGKYNLASEKTKLTYDDYMPVAGRIYDAVATVEITNASLTEDALWACPRNMTSAENDEWVVSSTSVYDNRAAWQAFDGNIDTSAWINSGNEWWIMWQNKKRKVLLQQIKIALEDSYILNRQAFLQGSNDGTEWVDIIPQGNFSDNNTDYENGRSTITLKIPNNGTPYHYIRLGSNYNTGSYSIIYNIDAVSQIPREVPK